MSEHKPIPLSAEEIEQVRANATPREYGQGVAFLGHGTTRTETLRLLATLDERNAEIERLDKIIRDELEIVCAEPEDAPAPSPSQPAETVSFGARLVLDAAKWAGEDTFIQPWFGGGDRVSPYNDFEVRMAWGAQPTMQHFATLCARYLVAMAKEQGFKYLVMGLSCWYFAKDVREGAGRTKVDIYFELDGDEAKQQIVWVFERGGELHGLTLPSASAEEAPSAQDS